MKTITVPDHIDEELIEYLSMFDEDFLELLKKLLASSIKAKKSSEDTKE